MKYCYECGSKLSGDEDICPQCGNEFEEIKVNQKKNDKAYFESTFLQNVSDQLDIFMEDANDILKEFDSSEFKKQIDDFNIFEMGSEAFEQVTDLKDETLKNIDVDVISVLPLDLSRSGKRKALFGTGVGFKLCHCFVC